MGVVLVSKVVSIGRAGHINTPECATRLALPETEKVNMADKSAILKYTSEFIVLDAIVVFGADCNGKINVTVCVGISCLAVSIVPV